MNTILTDELREEVREFFRSLTRGITRTAEEQTSAGVERLRQSSPRQERTETAAPNSKELLQRFGRGIRESADRVTRTEAREEIIRELTGAAGGRLRDSIMNRAYGEYNASEAYAESLWRQAGDIPQSLAKEKAYFRLKQRLGAVGSAAYSDEYERGARAYFAGRDFLASMDRERLKPAAGQDLADYRAEYMGLFDPYLKKYAADIQARNRYQNTLRQAFSLYSASAAPPEDRERLLQQAVSRAGWRYLTEEAQSSEALRKTLEAEENRKRKAQTAFYRRDAKPWETYLRDTLTWADEKERQREEYKQRIIRNGGAYQNSDVWSRGQTALFTTSLYRDTGLLSPEALAWGKAETDRQIFGENYNNAAAERYAGGNMSELRTLLREELKKDREYSEAANSSLRQLCALVQQLAKSADAEKDFVTYPRQGIF